MLSRQRLRVISSSLGVGVLLASLGIATLSGGAGAQLPNANTIIVSKTPAGGAANNESIGTSSSHDGRYVAFASSAINIGGCVGCAPQPAPPGAMVHQAYVSFIENAAGSNIVLASHTAGSATTPANADVFDVALSGDASFVVFATAATNLVTPAPTGGLVHIYRAPIVRSGSVITSVGTPVMVDAVGSTYGNGHADQQVPLDSVTDERDLMGGPKVDYYGNLVVFESRSTNLGATGPAVSAGSHIYVKNMNSGAITLVDANFTTPGVWGDGQSHGPQISDNGQFVVYWSRATNLLNGFGDNNGTSFDVFRRNNATGVTDLVSALPGPGGVNQGGNSWSDDPSISTTGRFVVFESHSTNLVTGVNDANGGAFSNDDVWIRDMQAQVTHLVSAQAANPLATVVAAFDDPDPLVTDPGPISATGTWLNPSGRMVSDDGGYVVFSSTAHDLVAPAVPAADANMHTFVRKTQFAGPGPTTTPIDRTPAAAVVYGAGSTAHQFTVAFGALIQHGSPTISPGGDTVFWSSNADNLVNPPEPSNNTLTVAYGDIFAKRWTLTLPQPTPPTTTTTTQPAATTQPTTGTTPTTPTTTAAPATTPTTQGPGQQAGPNGYWMASDNGQVYGFGSAAGTAQAAFAPAGTVSDIEVLPAGGYYLLEENGRVSKNGGAQVAAALSLNAGETAAAISITPSGNGYWIFTNRGRVFEAGDAVKRGDMSATVLNGPILDSVATPTGAGYYMVASDGGVFAFGDARFAGSMGGKQLNQPVQSLVPTATNGGYWLVAADGGIFAFGDAGFVGSIPGVLAAGQALNAPITGMVRYGNGYLMVATDGGIFSFSNRPFFGSLGGQAIARPIVAVAPAP